MSSHGSGIPGSGTRARLRPPARHGLAAVAALAAAMAAVTGAGAASAAMTPAMPKNMQPPGAGPAGGSAPGQPMAAIPPTAPQDDPWAGVLFNTADPWAPGAVPPQGVRRLGVPGAPGVGAGRPGGVALPPEPPVAPLAPGEKPKPERVQALYRQALVHWAEGKSEMAWGELVALETTVVSDKDPGSAKRLLRAEEKVIHQVAAADLEVLLPIARLHLDVYQLYVNQSTKGRTLVANHARAMVHDLAMLYRQQSGSQGAALVASHLLTTMAELLQRGSQHQAAAELYTQAAGLDPHNPVPALRLAVTYEKFEQYQSAASWLRKVVALDPANPEARLRLAVNLGRTGKTAEAAKLLEALCAESGDHWATPVAFQELARLEEERNPQRSEAVLRAGLLRYPQSVRMRVQLAALMDHEGKVLQGRQVIEEIPALQVGSPEEASRFRYNSSTAESVAASRTFFEQNAGSRLRVLADALARTVAAPAEAAAAPPTQPPGSRERRP